MKTILICDDDPLFAGCLQQELRSALKALQQQAKICRCHCAEDISGLPADRFDIVFLDIDFTGQDYTGLDIARSLRQRFKDLVIIFVTNYPSYAPEGYEVHAFRYLLKSKVSLKLKAYLAEALDHVGELTQTCTFTASRQSVTLPLEDILYIEAQAHSVNIYLQQPGGREPEARQYSTTLSQLEPDLLKRGFLRVQRSLLVNMRHIRSLRHSGVQLSTGHILPISKRSYTELKTAFLNWKGEQ